MSNADTLSEFMKSYIDGWVGLKQDKIIIPCRIAKDLETPTPNGHIVFRYLTSKEGKELSKDLNWVTDRNNLIRGYPDLGMVKVGPTVSYLKTRPFRQFKKGYVPANVEMFIPNVAEIRKVFPRFIVSSASREVVWQVFNREYWHPTEAIRLMDAGEGVGYPISQNFALYCRADIANILLLHKNRDIGVYDGDFKLFKASSMFKEQFTRETTVECKVA